jgi:hypothetical protein
MQQGQCIERLASRQVFCHPLTVGQPGEGKQPVTGVFQAVGNSTTFQSPFADE